MRWVPATKWFQKRRLAEERSLRNAVVPFRSTAEMRREQYAVAGCAEAFYAQQQGMLLWPDSSKEYNWFLMLEVPSMPHSQPLLQMYTDPKQRWLYWHENASPVFYERSRSQSNRADTFFRKLWWMKYVLKRRRDTKLAEDAAARLAGDAAARLGA